MSPEPTESMERKVQAVHGRFHVRGQMCSSLCTYGELENAGFVAKMRKCSSLCTYDELENAGFVAESVHVLQSVCALTVSSEMQDLSPKVRKCSSLCTYGEHVEIFKIFKNEKCAHWKCTDWSMCENKCDTWAKDTRGSLTLTL